MRESITRTSVVRVFLGKEVKHECFPLTQPVVFLLVTASVEESEKLCSLCFLVFLVFAFLTAEFDFAPGNDRSSRRASASAV